MKLSEELNKWRCERPDEWKMDEFIREAERLECEYEFMYQFIIDDDDAEDSFFFQEYLKELHKNRRGE